MCSALPWSKRKLYFGFLRSRSLITYGGMAWVRPPRGHAPARAGVEEAFSAERAAVNTRPGAYDRATAVNYLDDYVDRDTELYAAAVQIYEKRLAAAQQGKACI